MKIFCIRKTSKEASYQGWRSSIQYLTKQGDYTKSCFENIRYFQTIDEAEKKLKEITSDQVLDIFEGRDGYIIIVREQKGWKKTKGILEEKLLDLNIPFKTGKSCNGYVMTFYHLNDLSQNEKDELIKFSSNNDLDFDYCPGTVNYDSEGYFLNSHRISLNTAIFQG